MSTIQTLTEKIQQLNLQLYSAAFIALISATLLLPQASLDLIKDWSRLSEGYGHGVIIFILFLYLLHTALNAISNNTAHTQQTYSTDINTKKYHIILIAVLLLNVIIASLLSLSPILLLQQLLIPILFILLFSTMVGIKTGMVAIPSACILYFAIPIWNYLTYSLVSLSSYAVTLMLSPFNFPFYIDGNSIKLPQGEIIIAASCSGLRYFVIGMALSFMMIFTSRISYKKAVLFFGCSIALALLANWVRIFLLILIGYFSQMQSTLISEHDNFGWIVFMVFMLPLYFIYNKMPIKKAVSEHKNSTEKSIPVINYKNTAAIITLIFSIHFSIVHNLSLSNTQPIQLAPITAPASWHSNTFSPNITLPLPVMKNAQQTQQITLISSNYQSIYLQRQLFIPKSKNEDIFPYFPKLISLQWIVESETHVIGADNTHYKKSLIRKKGGQEKWLIYSSFNVGGISSSKKINAKLLQLRAIISGNAYSVISLMAIPCMTNCTDKKSQQHKLNNVAESLLSNTNIILPIIPAIIPPNQNTNEDFYTDQKPDQTQNKPTSSASVSDNS
ncbi:MAG: exosortase/archaeosortase family protein [Pseudomonadales bacterium]|nr:exosortase/archaeosortase family protein [Pseudomonadales bacterium]